MKEQKYKLKNVKSFELRDIFECGQCFRWNKQEDGSYTGVFKNNVLKRIKTRLYLREYVKMISNKQ